MGQLVERSPPTPEIRGSNPVIGKLLSNICVLSTVLKKRPGMAHFIKIAFVIAPRNCPEQP